MLSTFTRNGLVYVKCTKDADVIKINNMGHLRIILAILNDVNITLKRKSSNEPEQPSKYNESKIFKSDGTLPAGSNPNLFSRRTTSRKTSPAATIYGFFAKK